MKSKLLVGLFSIALIGIGTYLYVYRAVHLNQHPIILGHGGMGTRSFYPLNSNISVAKALSFSIDGTELDVKITADKVLVAFHDQELETNTNCTGSVASKTVTDLDKCTSKTWLRKEPIARLESILSSGYEPNTVFSLDLKPDKQVSGKLMDAYINELVRITETFSQFQFHIESPDVQLLNRIRSSNANAELYVYAHKAIADSELALNNDLDGISIHKDLISKMQVRTIQSKGLKVIVWGTGSVLDNRSVLELEPDIIQTDAICSMVKLMGKN